VKWVKSTDPASSTVDITSSSKDVNPFVDKRILVLSGGADKLVPWEASKDFVDALYVDGRRGGIKQVFVQDGAGHEVTEEMTSRLAEFVWEFGLRG
jgi:predicted esterase